MISQRTELGDPSFQLNVTEFQTKILSTEYASKVRAMISDQNTLPIESYNPKGFEIIETPGTSHISTSDASGLSIALTCTLNLWFGSRLMVPTTGLIMNNEMNDFSIPDTNNAFGYKPSPANYVLPGKRPLSSMAPTIVEHRSKSLYYALGASGGSYIITAVVQCLWNVLRRNMTLAAALAEPRFHDQLEPNVAEFEYAYSNDTVSSFVEKGHKVTWSERGSAVFAIKRLAAGGFEAVAEPSLNFGGGETL